MFFPILQVSKVVQVLYYKVCNLGVSLGMDTPNPASNSFVHVLVLLLALATA